VYSGGTINITVSRALSGLKLDYRGKLYDIKGTSATI